MNGSPYTDRCVRRYERMAEGDPTLHPPRLQFALASDAMRFLSPCAGRSIHTSNVCAFIEKTHLSLFMNLFELFKPLGKIGVLLEELV